MLHLGRALCALTICIIVPTSALSRPAPNAAGAAAYISLRPYVVETVATLAATRKLGGYDAHRRYTQDLTYGTSCCLRATRPVTAKTPFPTMCVAAVIETMVEALNLYAAKTGDRSFATALPIKRLDGDTRSALIPLVFKYEGSNSPGTGYALQQLGLGRELDFNRLAPGDFITLNRTGGTGHAVVFLGYLKNGSVTPTTTFSGDVVGFRYFSAQGEHRSDGGMGYRNAYFAGKCPIPRGKDDDCGVDGVIVRPDGSIQQNHWKMSAGEMFVPERTRVDAALARIRAQLSRSIEEEVGLTRGAGLEEAVEARLNEALLPDEHIFVDGSSEPQP